jgi:hypothetical protein
LSVSRPRVDAELSTKPAWDISPGRKHLRQERSEVTKLKITKSLAEDKGMKRKEPGVITPAKDTGQSRHLEKKAQSLQKGPAVNPKRPPRQVARQLPPQRRRAQRGAHNDIFEKCQNRIPAQTRTKQTKLRLRSDKTTQSPDRGASSTEG